jgi:hypothetical protein
MQPSTNSTPAAMPAVPPEYLSTAATAADPKRFTGTLEDPSIFENLAIDYHLRFSPVGPDEAHLVDNLVFADYQKRLLMTALTQVRQATDLIADLTRNWFGSLTTLERLQKSRGAAKPAQAERSEAQNPNPQPLSPTPALSSGDPQPSARPDIGHGESQQNSQPQQAAHHDEPRENGAVPDVHEEQSHQQHLADRDHQRHHDAERT